MVPGCFSPFLLSSRASSCPVTGCGLPGTGNAGFETRDRAPQRKTVVVCHDSPLRPPHTCPRSRVRCQTGNLSVYARHSPLGNFVWQRTWVEKHGVLGDFLIDVASAIRCCAPSLRRQRRWDGCATLASSPSARQLPVNRLTGCAPWRRCSCQFLSPYRNQNASDVRGALFATGQSEFPAGCASRQDPVAPAQDV